MSEENTFMGVYVGSTTQNIVNRYKKMFMVKSDDLLLMPLYQRGRALSYSVLNLKHEIDDISLLLDFFEINLGIDLDV